MPGRSDPPPSTHTLRDLLADEGRFPFDRATRILDDVGTALRSVHALGLAYGPIEPGRVLVDPGGRASLAGATADDTLIPPAYLAPELIDGRPGDSRSDLYSLGLLGWAMLAGRSPWAGESLYDVVVKQREQDLPRLTTLRPGIPRPLLLAIEGSLHKHPDDRWGTADEFLAQLRAGRTPSGVRPATTVPPRQAPRVAAAPAPPVSAGGRGDTSPSPSPRPAGQGPGPGETATPDPRAATSSAPRRRRRLVAAAVTIALLAGGAAALASLQGRAESRDTAAWLDSLSIGVEAGDVVIDSSADSTANAQRARAARLARERARRDDAARVAAERRAAEAGADSAGDPLGGGVTAPATDSARPGAGAATPTRPEAGGGARRDTAGRPSGEPAAARRDSTARPDTTSRG